ncbi:PepSY domain-containing protein [Ideonella sp. B7]|uniref:PepSY domain-containing protein n=1 Tax=Ideonella benzenivorans TaxID=2831643 RepID=UPI001CEC9451|nr:PepSY domain-containing protein [Ideonella benzenivorans]MCA6216874.1 PepSY domain-containing protein [Ideonella benzenivorans]
MKPIPLPLALCLALTTAPALADDDCEVPVSHWQSREAVMRYAAQQGWQVQSLKIDDGCYEVRGRDAQGRAFKAKLAPQTLRVVKMKLREHGHDADAGRHHDRGVPGRDAAPAQEAASASVKPPADHPVLKPGTAPRGQIE